MIAASNIQTSRRNTMNALMSGVKARIISSLGVDTTPLRLPVALRALEFGTTPGFNRAWEYLMKVTEAVNPIQHTNITGAVASGAQARHDFMCLYLTGIANLYWDPSQIAFSVAMSKLADHSLAMHSDQTLVLTQE